MHTLTLIHTRAQSPSPTHSSLTQELVDCIVANIDEAYTQEFYTLWGVNAATAASTGFRALLLQRYNKTGCQQVLHQIA